MSLRQSMELAGHNLLGMLTPSQGHLPFWSIDFDRDMSGRLHSFWPSHNVGRWWDAMLRLEATTGFRIPPDLEPPMMRNLAACLDNPLGLCAYLEPREGLPDGPDPAGWFDNHSQRELLLAIAALVRYRRSDAALAMGRTMTASLDRFILADGNWDIAAMARACRQGGMVLPDALEAFYAEMSGFRHVESHGRLIEALLEFHLAAGDQRAFDLAARLSRWHFEVSTRPDGSAPEGEHTHTHSYLGTLRGLLLYGQLSGEREYVDRVATTWAVAVRWYVKHTGFVSHDLRTEKDGETGSAGDVVQLALRLGRAGFPALLDDAERMVRCRLLPSQITSSLGLRPAVPDGHDRHERLDQRALGAFGGMHRHPHGEAHPTTDITAADLHALCDVYTHTVEETPAGVRVNFLFDYEDARIRIRSLRDAAARLEIRLTEPSPLLVRIPRWVPEASLRLTVNGRELPAVVTQGFLMVPPQEAAARIDIAHGLPTETVVERTDGVDYEIRWRGDEIMGIRPNTDWLPFYPSIGQGC